MASQWFYQVKGNEVGPLSSAELRNLAQRGVVLTNTLVKNAPDAAWVPAERVRGLFAVPNQAPRPMPVDGSAKHPSSGVAEDESSGLSAATKVVMGACGVVCMIVIGFLVWFVAFRDTWELHNAARVSAKLEEADRLHQSDPLTAYKAYDEVLKEAKQHKIKDEQFATKLANAEKSQTNLYPKVQETVRAEEAEKRRQAEEEAKRVAEEKQRIAEDEERKRTAEEKTRAEEKRLKEAIATYRNAPPSARNALNAVKKVEARAEVGITYKDYSTVVGEAWADVKIFAESPEGKKLPEFSFLLVSAMGKYKLALDIWHKTDTTLDFESEFQAIGHQRIPFYTKVLSDSLRQRCWGAAHRRIDMAESLITAEDIGAGLSGALRLQKTDANYEATLRSVLADLISYQSR